MHTPTNIYRFKSKTFHETPKSYSRPEKNVTQTYGNCVQIKTKKKREMSHNFNNYSRYCHTSAVPCGDFVKTSGSERRRESFQCPKPLHCRARSEFVRKRSFDRTAAEETASRRDGGRFEVVRSVTGREEMSFRRCLDWGRTICLFRSDPVRIRSNFNQINRRQTAGETESD